MKFFYIFILFFTSYPIFSQNDENFEKIKSLKIAHITEKINLTPSEAKLFWPVYNRYSEKLRDLNHQTRNCKEISFEQKNNLTEEEAIKILKKHSDINEKIWQVNKEKDQELLKIISAKKLLLLKNAEREFYKKLMNQCKVKK